MRALLSGSSCLWSEVQGLADEVKHKGQERWGDAGALEAATSIHQPCKAASWGQEPAESKGFRSGYIQGFSPRVEPRGPGQPIPKGQALKYDSGRAAVPLRPLPRPRENRSLFATLETGRIWFISCLIYATIMIASIWTAAVPAGVVPRRDRCLVSRATRGSLRAHAVASSSAATTITTSSSSSAAGSAHASPSVAAGRQPRAGRGGSKQASLPEV